MSDVGLGAELLLDIQAALAKIDSLSSSIDEALTGVEITAETASVTSSIDEAVQGADTDVEVEGDASDVTGAIEDAVAGADAEVPVDADTSAAESAIDELSDIDDVEVSVDADTEDALAAIEDVAQEAEAVDATIVVEAETSEAEGQIQSLGDEVAGTTGAFAGLTGGIEAFSGVGDSAAGVAGAMGQTIGNLSPQTKGAVAGIAALVGVTATLFNAAVESEASLRRFSQTTGVFADSIRDINVGSLNGQLGDLALKLGTSDEALQDAASRIFQLGTASGVAGPEVAKTTEQILALSLNARALNPALGESGQIAETMSQAFARGGRALAPFGIALTAAEINARALADTGKTTAVELTVYEKAAAGAALATEKFGDSFADNIALASDNPAIRIAVLKNNFGELIESLGQPLVVPLLDFLEDAEPAAEAVVTVIGEFIETLVSLGPVLQIAGEGLKVFARGLEITSTPLRLFGAVVGDITGLMGDGKDAVDKNAAAVQGWASSFRDADGIVRLTQGSLEGFVDSWLKGTNALTRDIFKEVGLSAEQLAGFLGQGRDGLVAFNAAVDASDLGGKKAGAAKDLFAELAFQIDAVAISEIKAAGESGALSAAEEKAALKSRDHVSALAAVQQQIDSHNAAIESATTLYGPLIAQVKASGDALTALGISAPEAKQAILDLTSGAIVPTDSSLLALAESLSRAKLSEEELTQAASALGTSTESLQGFIDGATGAVHDFVSAVVAGIPSTLDVFGQLADGAGIRDFIGSLVKSDEQVVQFFSDLRAIVAAGGQDIAATLAQAGVEGGASYARELAASINPGGKSKLVESAEVAVDQHNATIALAEEYVRETFGPAYIASTGLVASLAAEAFSGSLTFAEKTRLAANLAASGLDEDGQAIAVIAANKGADAARAYAELFDIDGPTVAQALAVVGTLTTASEPFNAAAAGTATAGVTGWTTGLADHLPATTQQQLDLAKGVIDAAATVMNASGLATGAAAHTGYEDSWSQLPQTTATGLAGAKSEIDSAAGPLHDSGAATGAAAHTGYEDTWSSLPQTTATGLAGAKDKIDQARSPFETAAGIVGSAANRGVADALGNTAPPGAAISGVAAYVKVVGIAYGSAAGLAVGRSIGQGMVAGVREYSDDIARAAAANVRAAERAARSEARSHSPSELFRDIGKDLGAGMEIGLSDTRTGVVAEAERIVRAAADGAASTDGLRVPFGFDGSTGGGDTAGGGLTMGDLIINVQAGDNADAEAIAAATAAAVDETLVDRFRAERQIALDMRMNA